jgi:hypothetical protein
MRDFLTAKAVRRTAIVKKNNPRPNFIGQAIEGAP